jgi:hypothetical protein
MYRPSSIDQRSVQLQPPDDKIPPQAHRQQVGELERLGQFQGLFVIEGRCDSGYPQGAADQLAR